MYQFWLDIVHGGKSSLTSGASATCGCPVYLFAHGCKPMKFDLEVKRIELRTCISNCVKCRKRTDSLRNVCLICRMSSEQQAVRTKDSWRILSRCVRSGGRRVGKTIENNVGKVWASLQTDIKERQRMKYPEHCRPVDMILLNRITSGMSLVQSSPKP